VTWVKPNPMPQSVKDRLNTTTEQIFHLTPQPDYWYDLDAIREPHAPSSKERIKHSLHQNHPEDSGVGVSKTETDEMGERFAHPAGKNPGDVFEVTTKPFPDAHFAVYPPALCDKPIKASCPPKVCVDCGSPYEREVERTTPSENDVTRSDSGFTDKNETTQMRRQNPAAKMRGQEYNEWKQNNPDKFKGWLKPCDCDTDDTEPGIVLDPFAGAGTTLLKAKELGRRFVGVELNPDYADMARARVGLDVNDASRIRDDAQQHGLEGFAE